MNGGAESEDFVKNLHRFATTIEYPNDVRLCWMWRGDANEGGYGRFWYKGKKYPAHRVMMCLLTGQPHPEGKVIDHMCSVTGCVNPFHLRFLTPLQNMRVSRVVSGRKTRGSLNGQSKLTEQDIKNIRREYASGAVTQRELATKYGTSQALISLIFKGKKWGYIGP